MKEILEIPWNGFKVASTFSGAGGSCLGYQMAGFKVIWANEINKYALLSHKVNFPDCILDHRSIREIKADEVLETLQLELGQLDLLDGSPPCTLFSTAGKRAKGWGEEKDHAGQKQSRIEDLFFDYIRLIEGLKPKVFIAENVSGLIKGVSKGYFKEILTEMKKVGYQVKAKLLDAQWLGVPQQRKRIIFIGVRDDLELQPQFPKPFPYQYSVKEVLPQLIGQQQGQGFGQGKWSQGDEPSQTIGTGPSSGNGTWNPSRVRVIEETGGQWGSGDITERPATTDCSSGVGQLKIIQRRGGWSDPQQVEETPALTSNSQSRLMLGPKVLPFLQNLKPGETSDKYFQLSKLDPGLPSPTVTGPSGTGLTLPYKERRLNIQELKVLCSFSDDFYLAGSYSQQWRQLGNSVPPLMMKAIAEVVQDEILMKIKN